MKSWALELWVTIGGERDRRVYNLLGRIFIACYMKDSWLHCLQVQSDMSDFDGAASASKFKLLSTSSSST